MSKTDLLAITAVVLSATAVALSVERPSGDRVVDRPAQSLEHSSRPVEQLSAMINELDNRLKRLEQNRSAYPSDFRRMQNELRSFSSSIRDINDLVVRVAILEQQLTNASADDLYTGGSQHGSVGEAGEGRIRPQYIGFTAPGTNILVEQDDNGSLYVHNDDPSLAMQTISVYATKQDGTVDEITLTIPPPEDDYRAP